MSPRLNGLLHQYGAALRQHLKQRASAHLPRAKALGRKAITLGLETLDLARIHEQALITLVSSGGTLAVRDAMIRRAGIFFAEALTPIEQTHRTSREASVRLEEMVETLNRRSADLALSNRELKQEIAQRKAVEEALRKSEQHYRRLLAQSHGLQDQLRHLSHQLLSAQEEERKKISRELHDEIAQTLASINVRLGALKEETSINTEDLQRKITSTQRLVEKSVDIVHRFARELRPTVLDDLGLIPALHSFAKSLAKRTGLRVHLKVFSGVEELDNAKRTVLYRVAQEALTNVARHAHAGEVEVNIGRLPGAVRMEIKDDGKSFQVQRVLHAKRNNRLGLLGMRERVEMVGGSFRIESSPDQGTTVRAEIPFPKANVRAGERKTD